MTALSLSAMKRYPAYAFLSAYSLIILVPMFWMVVASVKNRGDMFTRPFSLPTTINWGGYLRAWTGGLLHYVFNSVIVTGISVFFIIVVSGLAAYALARMRFIGRGLIYSVVIAAYAVPVHGILVPLYDTLVKLGLTNTYFGLILPYITFGLPFSITLLYAFFIDFPGEMIEAARIDGCSELGAFWRIVVPLSMPAVASVAIFQGVQIWNEFLLALIVISSDGLKTVPLGLVAFRGNYVSDWTAILASITVTSLPMLILFMAFQRQFIKSLAGSSK
jgi:multiple sugar transport system permease protein/raffinose/stachyose/melibiose transport system permease protein